MAAIIKYIYIVLYMKIAKQGTKPIREALNLYEISEIKWKTTNQFVEMETWIRIFNSFRHKTRKKTEAKNGK